MNPESHLFSRYWELYLEASTLARENNQYEFYTNCQPDHARMDVMYAILAGEMEIVSDNEIKFWLEKTYSEFVRCMNDVYGESRHVQVLECVITPGCGVHPGVGEAYYVRFLERSI